MELTPTTHSAPRRKPRFRRLIWVVAIGLYSLAFLMLGATMHQRGTLREIRTALPQGVSIVPKLIRGFGAQPEHHIVIDIKHKHFQKLAYKREVALATGVLLTSSEDYVPAEIRHGDAVHKVKLRLKGDWVTHVSGDKWSFRVNVKGDDTLLGMKRFSLHHPSARQYLHEWVMHRALKAEGHVALRYEFVAVTLNGRDLGIYALEEHFEKRLIESNDRREGPIIKFSEDLLWKDRARQHDSEDTAYYSSSTEPFRQTKTLENPVLRQQFMAGAKLLEGFKIGTLPAEEVFDVPKLASYFALCDLLGARHMLFFHNYRFYFNPVTTRLEPIGFDAADGKRITRLIGSIAAFDDRPYLHFNRALFRDPSFIRAYYHALIKVASANYIDDFLAQIDVDLQEQLDVLYSEFPWLQFSVDTYRSNQRTIQKLLDPIKAAHAYFEAHDEGMISMHVGNIQPVWIEVVAVHLGDTRVPLAEAVMVPGKAPDQPVDIQAIQFTLPETVAWTAEHAARLQVEAQVLGQDQPIMLAVFPWTPHGRVGDPEQSIPPPNIAAFEYLNLDAASGVIRIQPGDWTIDKDMVIPPDHTLSCGPGTTLRLSNGSSIVSWSPVQFVGTETDPIRILDVHASSQGMAVLEASSKSTLEHVTFDGLSNPQQRGWILSGAVNFYESPVDIRSCEFSRNRCEDSLNIIRSAFAIADTRFTESAFDAFDGDFTTGTITNTFFDRSGNDAIDVSGSHVSIGHVHVVAAGDKGLSAGEGSHVEIERLTVEGAAVGVASKDQSHVDAKVLRLDACAIGITAYQKKSEFGPASMTIASLVVSNTPKEHLIEAGCDVVVDGAPVSHREDAVEQQLYGAEDAP
jgi:hypothetical protein